MVRYGDLRGLISAEELRACSGEELQRKAEKVMKQERGVSLVCSLALYSVLETVVKSGDTDGERVVDTTIATVASLLFDSWNRVDLAEYAQANGALDI